MAAKTPKRDGFQKLTQALIGSTHDKAAQFFHGSAEWPKNDWHRVAVAGELYPRAQYRITQNLVGDAHPATARPGEHRWMFIVWDETGWDGYREYDPTIVGVFDSYEEAEVFRKERLDAVPES